MLSFAHRQATQSAENIAKTLPFAPHSSGQYMAGSHSLIARIHSPANLLCAILQEA